MTIPRATLRLQFHKGFTFADAEKRVGYFARLGVSHVYASPITTARPGSMHGYDVIDPTHVNLELGGEDALRSLVRALRRAGLGLIADIVPNHMAASDANGWWFDVLRNGAASRYASYFDIDWYAEEDNLGGKVLLPVLGKPLSEVLRDGEITLARDGQAWILKYFQHRFPVCGAVREGESLGKILERQHYRLAWWRIANDEINWRRFFDINELAGLRMENPDAFADVHALILRLYSEGIIDGVRVDHIDGLADPAAYCRTLRARLDALTPQRPPSAPGGAPYIVVEKILLRGETLPQSWRTDGTSGYDFMNEVGAVQNDAAGEAALDRLWASVSGRTPDFAVEEQAARRETVARGFSAQLESCVLSFHRLVQAEGIEVSRASLRRGLTELLAHFPVYRTYVTATERPASDAPFFDAAVRGAKTTCLSIDRAVIDRLQDWFAQRSNQPAVAPLQERAITQFQQLSAPVAAKAVEDTAFYRYGRLLSRNDVGFATTQFADSTADFHAHMQARHTTFSHAMLATATHDHKRGEDVRARLAVLSEYAHEWAQAVPRWIAHCNSFGVAPGDIAMLLQTIVGAWPLELKIGDVAERRAFAERLAQWQEKALREAKVVTDWAVPNDIYESAARNLVKSFVESNEHPAVLAEIAAFSERIAPAGAVNGLAQTLLKFTAPGVPDIYQGTELWDFSLVDPDNRRPVDFASRDRSLPDDMTTLAATWRDGRIKQALIMRLLTLRQKAPELFSEGGYWPLAVSGEHSDRVIAFERRKGHSTAVVVAPRAASRLLRKGEISFESAAWVNTQVALQHETSLVDLFSQRRFDPSDRTLSVAKHFGRLPFALLVSADLM